MRIRQRKQRRTRRLRRGGDIEPNYDTGSNTSADVFQQGRLNLKTPTDLRIRTPSQTAHEFQKVQLKTTPKAGRRTRRKHYLKK